MIRLITSIVVVALVVADVHFVSAQDQGANQAPEQKSFSINPATFGALKNSVTAQTGQVSFPMDIATLPGKGGLNASVRFSYSSGGVPQQSTLLNEFSPTGIIGLGWSMDMPRIIVDNKKTGTRHDDEFFLVEGGSSNRLLCVDVTHTPRKYITSNYNFWVIEYYPDDEKWVIKKEDGFKYVYGDKNSGRNTVQWIVKWGNWIGNSTQPNGQEKSGYIWNLSQIFNNYDETIVFHYDADEEYVAQSSSISTEQQHTKASYLSKIVDPIGQSIELTYASKTSNEIFDPHTEQSEPDAYQEKFESKYLTTVTAKGIGGLLLYYVDLTYSLIDAVDGSSDQKRLLTSIQKRFPSTETQPPVQFTYQTGDACHACLLKVTNSLGAEINYFYQKYDVGAVTQTGPGMSGWGQPVVYAQDNYVIATFRKLASNGNVDTANPQNVRIMAYYWNGTWAAEQLWETTGVNAADYDAATMALSERHFIYRLMSSGGSHVLYYARKSDIDLGTGQWVKNTFSTTKNGNDPNHQVYVMSGDNFVAFVDRATSVLYTYVWKVNGWQGDLQSIPNTPNENFCTSGPNWVLVHNDNYGNADRVFLYYLDETLRWHRSDVPTTLTYNTDTGTSSAGSYWHGSPSFAVGFIQYHDELVYWWDEDYTNFVADFDVLDRWDDSSPVSIVNNSTIGIRESGGKEFYDVRFDGDHWTASGQIGFNWQNIHFGDDFAVWDDYKSDPGVQKLLQYDPNSRSWSAQTLGYDYRSSSAPFLDIQDEFLPVRAGSNSLMLRSGILYRRQPSGSFTFVSQLPLTSSRRIYTPGIYLETPNYVAYNFASSATQRWAGGSYLIELRNHKLGALQTNNLGVIGSSMATSAGAIALTNGNGVIIYKLGLGTLDLYTVSRTQWSDGNHVSNTAYGYTNGNLSSDGQTVYFNIVDVVPGSKVTYDWPYGKTRTFYYNGQQEEQFSVAPASDNHLNDELLVGSEYATKVYNQTTVIASSEIYYMAYGRTVKDPDNVDAARGNYVRVFESHQTTDNVESKTITTYAAESGLPRTVTTYNSVDTHGTPDPVVTTYRYWYESYDSDLSSGRNMLLPAVLTLVTKGTTNMESTATKWKHISTKWYPDESWAWLRNDDPPTFTWTDGVDPSSDWLRTSKTTIRDEDDGMVLESLDAQNEKSVTLFDSKNLRPLATAGLASLEQVAFTSFEDDALGNWDYSPASISNADAVTGKNSFTNSVSKDNIPAGQYEVSYWEKGGTAAVNVTNGTVSSSTSADTYDSWTLKIVVVNITSTGEIEVNASGAKIDEVRLKPVSASMTSYVYDEFGNATSSTDTNLTHIKTEYDTQYRTTLIRDGKNKILKKYNYHYRNQ